MEGLDILPVIGKVLTTVRTPHSYGGMHIAVAVKRALLLCVSVCVGADSLAGDRLGKFNLTIQVCVCVWGGGLRVGLP